MIQFATQKYSDTTTFHISYFIYNLLAYCAMAQNLKKKKDNKK